MRWRLLDMSSIERQLVVKREDEKKVEKSFHIRNFTAKASRDCDLGGPSESERDRRSIVSHSGTPAADFRTRRSMGA